MVKSILVGILIFAVLVGFFAFSSWGLDFEFWDVEQRALAYIATVVFSVGGALAYYGENRA